MNEIKHIYTKGNVEVQNIKVGDIHWEYEPPFYAKVEVTTLPERKEHKENEQTIVGWSWKSKILEDGKISSIITLINFINAGKEVNYIVTEGLSQYAPNLYDYPAYHPLEYQTRI